MTSSVLVEQVELVRKLERRLREARKKTAANIRIVREACGLSLQDVAGEVGRGVPTLSYLERGKTWQSETALRVAQVLDARCQGAA